MLNITNIEIFQNMTLFSLQKMMKEILGKMIVKTITEYSIFIYASSSLLKKM